MTFEEWWKNCEIMHAMDVAEEAWDAAIEEAAKLVDHIMKEGGGTYADYIRRKL